MIMCLSVVHVPQTIFLRNLRLTLARRLPFFALINLVFFGSVLIGVFFAQPATPPLSEKFAPPSFFPLLQSDLPTLVVVIFLSNLVLSAFLLLTLTGMVFFAIPVVVLVWRAWDWSNMISQLPTSLFLVALPTMILEGEGYVMASAAGVVLGLSWLMPSLIFDGESLSRVEALKRAFREAGYVYIVVATILFVAALVEAFILGFLT